MRYDAIGLISRGAEALRKDGDAGTAFALYELANNLRLVMRGEASLDDWREVYVGADRPSIDIDVVLPVPEDA